jgi:hypothetical protein
VPAPVQPLPLLADFFEYQRRHPPLPEVVDAARRVGGLMTYVTIAQLLGQSAKQRGQSVRVVMMDRYRNQVADAIGHGLPRETAGQEAWLGWARTSTRRLRLPWTPRQLGGMSWQDLRVEFGWWVTGRAGPNDLPDPVGWVGRPPSASPRFHPAQVRAWAMRTGRLTADDEPLRMTAAPQLAA